MRKGGTPIEKVRGRSYEEVEEGARYELPHSSEIDLLLVGY